MNCDDVFDVLTRGPFPSGDPRDGDVELHLLNCDECRRLAKALRPAVELLHESVSAEESRDLPGYWGQLFDAREEGLLPDDEPASCSITASEPARPEPQPRRLAALGRTWRILVAVAAGALLAIALNAFGPAPTPRGYTAQNPGLSVKLGPDAAGRAALAALPVSTQCLADTHAAGQPPAKLAELASSPSNDAKLCCSRCHAAANPQRPTAPLATALAVQSCQICHRQAVTQGSQNVALDPIQR